MILFRSSLRRTIHIADDTIFLVLSFRKCSQHKRFKSQASEKLTFMMQGRVNSIRSFSYFHQGLFTLGDGGLLFVLWNAFLFFRM
jgi:hypothetical protein